MNHTIPNRLPTIDGETLMSKPLQPLNFVVDTLISQGLHILAGSPKVGKSWLALWLAVTVAKGEPVWGLSVKQGTTLYLCLEDSQLRIQNRLFDVTEDAPPNVHFCTESRILGDGLEEQLRQFLTEHPDTSLVIIDTLQMIRGTTYDNTYANDYRDLSALKKLADAHGIAILLIHHLRKEKADDVFNRISGTTAISGAVDASFTLWRSSAAVAGLGYPASVGTSNTVNWSCAETPTTCGRRQRTITSGQSCWATASFFSSLNCCATALNLSALPLSWHGASTLMGRRASHRKMSPAKSCKALRP